MNILANIAAHKRLEVAERRVLFPVTHLVQSPLFDRVPISMTEHLLRDEASGIIAEFKKMSPSKGIIHAGARVEDITTGYLQAGASALSVLTDTKFFGGSNEDLLMARKVNSCPILRKDFVVDPYQVIEAKSIGADAILLIAAILTPAETLELATLARTLGMETILEVHGESEMGHLNDQISILGVNNRNLADFKVSLDISIGLSELIPDGVLAISESGIQKPSDIFLLRQYGYKGFLIGEQFMSTDNPAATCEAFISELKEGEK